MEGPNFFLSVIMDHNTDFEHVTTPNGNITVYLNGETWVAVRPSPVAGRGLFARRHFHYGDTIGFYTGFVLGRAPRHRRLRTHREREVEREADRRERGGNDMLMTIQGVMVDGGQRPQSQAQQREACGRAMWPRTAWPGAYVMYINSCFDVGQLRCVRSRINCEIQADGRIVALRHIPPGTEFIMDYDESGEYYVEMLQRGTAAAPIEL